MYPTFNILTLFNIDWQPWGHLCMKYVRISNLKISSLWNHFLNCSCSWSRDDLITDAIMWKPIICPWGFCGWSRLLHRQVPYKTISYNKNCDYYCVRAPPGSMYIAAWSTLNPFMFHCKMACSGFNFITMRYYYIIAIRLLKSIYRVHKEAFLINCKDLSIEKQEIILHIFCWWN